MTDDPPTDSLPQSPTPVLPYRAESPLVISRRLVFESDGQNLTITVPPASVAQRIVVFAFIFVVFATPAMMFFAELFRGLHFGSARSVLEQLTEIVAPGFIFLLMAWAAVVALRRLIYVARGGHEAAVIRLWPGGIDVRAQGEYRRVAFCLSADSIVHVQLRWGRNGRPRTLWLEISSKDGGLHLANLGWPFDVPTQRLEDSLRRMLQLSPQQLEVLQPRRGQTTRTVH